MSQQTFAGGAGSQLTTKVSCTGTFQKGGDVNVRILYNRDSGRLTGGIHEADSPEITSSWALVFERVDKEPFLAPAGQWKYLFSSELEYAVEFGRYYSLFLNIDSASKKPQGESFLFSHKKGHIGDSAHLKCEGDLLF